jgi:type VI protein secretion system component VasF
MGQKMKNLGIRSGLLLLAIVAVLQTSAATGTRTMAKIQPHHDGRDDDHPERGDVPGWVMITLMSAVLVAALLALAGPALETMFNQAMDKVGK